MCTSGDGPRFESQESDSEAVDQIPEPSIEDIFALLKTIQIELSALGNKTTEENQELKSQIVDLRVKILHQGDEIRRNQSQISQKIGAHHEEMKKEFADLSKDLKGQMTTLLNQSQHEQKNRTKCHPSDEKKEISKENGQTKEKTFDWNRLIKIQLESPTSSALSAPQLYPLKQFEGTPFIPSFDWKTQCVNLPSLLSWGASVKTGGHCLLVCPEDDCKGICKSICQQINGDVGNLKDIGLP